MVVEHLQRTRDAFVAATQGLSEAQYRFSTGAGCWSIGEIAEHVALAERRILDLVTTKLPLGGPPGPDKATGAARFARLEAVVPSRDQRKIEAPEVLRPTGAFPTVAAAVAAFVGARNACIELAGAAGPEARAHVVPHRFFGDLDIDEWLYFTGLHVARHTAQVQEIQQAPGYPA